VAASCLGFPGEPSPAGHSRSLTELPRPGAGLLLAKSPDGLSRALAWVNVAEVPALPVVATGSLQQHWGLRGGHHIHCPALRKGESHPRWMFILSGPFWRFLRDFPPPAGDTLRCPACLTPSLSAQAGSHKAALVLLGVREKETC